MEYIIQILILFILIACLLKLSFLKLWQAARFGFVCAAFVVVTGQWAVLQSKMQLADFLSNGGVMQNFAVLITLETAIGVAFCFAAAGRGVVRRALRWYPGLLVFPVLFYLQTQLIFAMPGTDFTLLSYSFAAVVFVTLPVGARLIALLLPERELRLEVYFLVNLFVCIIGLITTVNGNTTYSTATEPINIKVLLLSAGVFAVFFSAGILLNRRKYTSHSS